MTNPNNAIGTNAAYSGRTSVNSFNDVLSVLSRGIISGWACSPSSGLTVVLGGDGTTRDVAIAEDNIGNRTTINNISGTQVSVTMGAAPTTNSRIDLIVAYVDNPPEGSSSITDNYEACGLIVVEGTPSASPTAPLESDIRTAITTDGGSGVTAYYVILAEIAIASGTTDIDASMITQGIHAGVANQNIQDDTISPEKFAEYAVNNAVLTTANLSPTTDTPADWNTLLGKNGYFLTYYRQAGIFTNQPEQYGMLETINYAGRIIQRWIGSTGVTYWRSGTAVGWSVLSSGAFRIVLDQKTAFTDIISTSIAQNADINTLTYIQPGRYSCTTTAKAQSLINCPTGTAFYMMVTNMATNDFFVDSTSTYRYLRREIYDINGKIWEQIVSSSGTAPVSWTYGNWNIISSGVETGSFTMESGFNVFAPRSFIKKVGNLITWQLEFTTSTTMSAGTTYNIGTMPTGFRPPVGVRSDGSTTSGINIACTVDTDGEIDVCPYESIGSGASRWVGGSYFIN